MWSMSDSMTKAVRWIVLPYLLFASLWILVSDELLAMLPLDGEARLRWSMYKGWAFVLVTALLLVLLLRNHLRARDQALGQLAESEARLRAIADHTPDHIVLQDGKLRHRFVVNPPLGLSMARMLGKTDAELFGPDDAERLTAIKRGVVESGRSIRLEVPIRNPAGEAELFEGTFVPRLDEAGRVNGVIGYLRNVTERKRLEADRDALARRNENLVRALGQIVYDHDVPRDRIVWSGEIKKVLGYSAEELGQTMADWLGLVHPDDVARVRSQFDIASGGSWFEVECRYRHQRGHYIWTTDRGVIERDARGQVARVCGILRDITGRKEAEAALHDSEERLRLALEAARMGTFDWDVPVNRLVWSRWHEALWGFHPGEFDGTYEAFASRIHPDDLPGLEGEVRRCIADRTPFVREFRVVWPDGGVHWILGTGEFTFDAAGRAMRMRGTVKEVTRRRLGEEELSRSREQLRALSARLETLREEERTRISREIHDELGQMLTALKMDLRWIENRLDEIDDEPRLNPVLDRLVAADELANATVKTVQRIAAELRPGILDKLGLGMTLQYEAAQFEQRFGIPCRVQLTESEPPLAPKVATAFFRIFQEALTNVARHAGATAIEVDFRPGADSCELEIRDNGRGLVGVDLANLESLGLLGMRERARLLGGEVAFGSRSGGGARVTVSIPCRTAGESTG